MPLSGSTDPIRQLDQSAAANTTSNMVSQRKLVPMTSEIQEEVLTTLTSYGDNLVAGEISR